MDERRKSGVTKRGAPTVSNMPRRGRELVDALYKHLLTGKPLAPRDRTELISRLTWFRVDPAERWMRYSVSRSLIRAAPRDRSD